MAVAVSRPSGRRADDVRALRFRFRTLSFTGNYATGGETIQAASVGLKRILAVLPANVLVRAPGGVIGNIPAIDVAADGRSVVIRHLEDAGGAVGAGIGTEKNNGEAYGATITLDVVFIGE